MLQLLSWPPLPDSLTAIWQHVGENLNALSNQDGYRPEMRYAGLWSWPQQTQVAETINLAIGLEFNPNQYHLQWVKPPGIGFHCDRRRHLSATCVLTEPHPTDFRVNGVVTQLTMQTGRWYLFDHWVEHAVSNLQQDRYAVCIDLTNVCDSWQQAVKQFA